MSRDIYELIEKMIDKKVKGADTYINQGSRWLILTDEKKWIFELTKEETLWYNYYFFENIFKIISLDVVENQHHVTKWVENFIQNGVKNTFAGSLKDETTFEDTIQNGVKETNMEEHHRLREVVQTVKNGVKHTEYGDWLDGDERLDDIIQNGIKNTLKHSSRPQEVVDNTIKNGIKETKQEPSQRTWMSEQVINNGIMDARPEVNLTEGGIEEIIEDGIKDTVCGVLEIYNPINFEPEFSEMKRMNEVNQVLEKGIKETKTPNDQNFADTLDFLDYNGSTSVPNIIDHVIQNGIKEVKELPDKSGELKGYGDYYDSQKDRTYPHDDIVSDVIRDGIKETKTCELHSAMSAEHIIRDGIKETWGYTQQPQVRVNEVINKGEKTIWNNNTTEL